MAKFVSYESWEKDFFTIPNLRNDLYHVFEENSICETHEDTASLLIFRKGGHIEKFKDGTIDFIMVDGAHEYEAVIDDIENWWPKLKDDGVMFGDDYELEAVKQAVSLTLPKVKAPSFTVNQSKEQTWYSAKDGNQLRLEKMCPGLNCLT